MIPQEFEYLAPKTLPKALKLLEQYGAEAKVLGGGQSLLPLMKLRLAAPRYVIDLNEVGALRYITQKNSHFVVGAMTTHRMIEQARTLQRRCPLLPQTAAQIGDPQVRNRGTIGGSLAHADPAADWPAALLALDAELKLISVQGERSVKMSNFLVDTFTTALRPDELLAEIQVSVFAERQGSAYVKVEQPASGFALVGVAALLRIDENGVCQDARLGVTGTASTAFRATAAETALRGRPLDPTAIEQSIQRVTDGVTPLNDLHASAEYRAHLARLCAQQALERALAASKSSPRRRGGATREG